MSVTGARHLCLTLGLFTLGACQGMVLNPHGEDPSVQTDPRNSSGEGTGVNPPGADPPDSIGTDGDPIINDPSEPQADPGGGGANVPRVPPTEEADPVFSQPDAGAAEATLALDGGTATQQTDAEARTNCWNEQGEPCHTEPNQDARQPHQDAGVIGE